ncbi:BglG family transcription antiterminator [Staphylococcus hominis]|uniref:BglG family transcription antiterminator n=1 Tax=Staphylococcus hominis TaxID=1290 RepID=UPI000C7B50DC|nr:BglG family transcription antiterminator [Staphylococcus hominis]MCI2894559.1 BglG family transcription antiterminator [Staphylococcus hominis]MCI2903120.1 BglG family transcription antiterminator [Staphylococcus hominis]MCI2905479.1 BglG family transcription antiterminator [Staphylococcus hominis]MCI2912073.1 BglG family transcription antiterminator [Staphylococcus hominis]MCT1470611.1 BglG family transcription antiterminator [Staphylococcus hominis]
MIERQKKIIELFLNNYDTYLNANEIAQHLTVSNRTIRSDIKYINNDFLKSLIISVKSRGYMLNTEDYEIDDINNLLKSLDEKDSEILINLGYHLLMQNSAITLNKLEKDYHISRTKLLDYLSRIQAWCEKFNVKIEIKRKKGISIFGSVNSINNAILHLNQLSEEDNSVEDLILNELPKSHINILFNIVQENLEKYRINTSAFKIKQLVIHLILIMKRKEPEKISWKIDQEALEIAEKCTSEINSKLKYNLNAETSKLFSFFISYHFNKFELGIEKIFIKSYINRLINLMEKNVGVKFSEDKLLKENLYSHFSRTYLRLTKNIYLNNPLVNNIKKLYPFIFSVLFEVIETLHKESNITLSEDEIAFLTIHFQSSIERNEEEQFRVVIACYYGLGVSNLLEAKISKLNKQINVIDIIKLEEVNGYDFSNTDLLVTTNEIDKSKIMNDINVLIVTPLFSKEDENKFKYYMNEKRNPISINNKLDNIIVETDKGNYNNTLSIFKRVNEILENNKAIENEYIDSVLEREKFSSTYIGNGIAIPHGNPEKVLKSHIIIFKSKKDIKWKQYNVNLVFFLAISKKDLEVAKSFIQSIAKLSEIEVKRMINLSDKQIKDNLINLIKE